MKTVKRGSPIISSVKLVEPFGTKLTIVDTNIENRNNPQ